MKKSLSSYMTDFQNELNMDLMNNTDDVPLKEKIVDCWKILESIENIKILSWEYDDDVRNLDINDFIIKRDKKKKKKDRVNLKFINEDRFGSIKFVIEISSKTVRPDGSIEINKKIIKKSMIVPIQDDDGTFWIKGKKYYMIYQLVDKSTYTITNGVALKSFMGIVIKRNTITKKDIGGVPYVIPMYTLTKYKKEVNVLYFYLNHGMYAALGYLDMVGVIDFTDKPVSYNDEENIYFPISSKLNLVVNKELFDKYIYVQSIVGMILDMTTNRITMDDIKDPKYWVKKLGDGKYEKGKSDIALFYRMLDESTKKTLKSNYYNKKDMAALVKWMMIEYNELRLKDNLSLENKRLRRNEYIAMLLSSEFTKRANRVKSLGNKATIDDFKDIFKFPGDILMQQMNASGILRYDENINSMDMFSKFKITSKGPNSLGNKNDKNIGIKHRGIHPSFLGYIDILVCGNSDKLCRAI